MTQPHATTAPMLSERQFWAAAAALLAAAALSVYPPTTANAGAADATPAAGSTMHAGVDWSRVAATPVDTGATVGAYDR